MVDTGVFQNVNKAVVFDSTSASNYQLLYTPGTKFGINLDGYVVDFIYDAYINSIDELSPATVSALSTTVESANTYYEIAKLHPNKRLNIYFEYADNPGQYILRSTNLIWRRQPYSTGNFLGRLTKRPSLLVGAGTKIYGRIEDGGHGLLTGTDKIIVSVSASEEAPSGDIIQAQEPTIYNIDLVNANTEYDAILPAGTRRFYLKNRGDVDDPAGEIRYAWNSGIVANRSGNYDVVPYQSEDGEDRLYLEEKTLYLASSTAGTVVSLKVWQ